jgi:hypothetical protein
VARGIALEEFSRLWLEQFTFSLLRSIAERRFDAECVQCTPRVSGGEVQGMMVSIWSEGDVEFFELGIDGTVVVRDEAVLGEVVRLFPEGDR